MEEKSIQPHDWFFKQIFSKPKNVKDFLDIFVPDLSQKIQPNSLELVPTEKFSDKQKKHILDLLFKCKLKDKEAYIRLVFEHKSYVDKKLPLQLMQYNTTLWEAALREKDYYPPIINIVFYHGQGKWNIPTTVPDIEDKDLDKYIQKLNYVLVDLNKVEDENLKGYFKRNFELISQMLIMKYIYEDWDKLKFILKEITVECTEDCLYIIFDYIVYVKKDYKKVEEVIKEISGGNEKMMSFTEKLKMEGRLEGKLEGRLEGRLENLRENIIDLMEVRFGFVDEVIVEKINQLNNIETLKQIFRMVAKSQSFDEVKEKLKEIFP